MKIVIPVFIIVCTLILAITSSATAQLIAGTDMFQATAEVEIILPDGTTEILELQGSSFVKRDAPGDVDNDGMIDQSIEMVQLELRGVSSQFGEVSIQAGAQLDETKHCLRPSVGLAEELLPGATFPAYSFFDIFAELEVSGGPATDGQPVTANNPTPARLVSIINRQPPIGTPHKASNIVFAPIWDINRDGTVNITDLILVVNNLGRQEPDLNCDGKVDLFDLVIVARYFGRQTRDIVIKKMVYIPVEAPPALAPPVALAARAVSERGPEYPELLSDIPLLHRTRQLLEAIPNPNAAISKAISELGRLVAVAKEQPVTRLLLNYPNPFNPETWMPYQLAEDSDVTVSIYDVSGRLIRRLHLGRRPAGLYITRSKAAYWDGTNRYGEKVASGVYLYTFQAGHFAANGKLLMIK